MCSTQKLVEIYNTPIIKSRKKQALNTDVLLSITVTKSGFKTNNFYKTNSLNFLWVRMK